MSGLALQAAHARTDLRKGGDPINREQKQMILAGTLISGGGQGALINTLSIFVKPVSDALGLSRGSFTLAATLSSLAVMLSLPIYGRIYQKRWFPWLMLAAALVCPLVLVGYSFSKALTSFYTFALVQGLLFNAISLTAVAYILNTRFDEERGIATGICFAGSGLFGAALLRLGSYVIDHFGWQCGYRTIGVTGMVFLVAGFLLMNRTTRVCASDVLVRDLMPSPLPDGLTQREAVCTPSFWFLVVGSFLLTMIGQSTLTSIAAYLSDLNFEPSVQSNVTSIGMLSLATGKIVMGKLLDRKGFAVGATVTAASTFGFLISLLLMRNLLSIGAYVVLSGIGISASSVLASYACGYCFGRRDAARILASIHVMLNLGAACGNIIPGLLFDHSGSYRVLWYLLLACCLLLSVCFTQIRPLVLCGQSQTVGPIHKEES